MHIYELVSQAWQCAQDKGFHDMEPNDRSGILVRLCLIHSEVSEAVQEVKRTWTDPPSLATRDRLAEELADVLIRVGDLCGVLLIDLDDAVQKKLAYNRTRNTRYGTPEEQAVCERAPVRCPTSAAVTTCDASNE